MSWHGPPPASQRWPSRGQGMRRQEFSRYSHRPAKIFVLPGQRWSRQQKTKLTGGPAAVLGPVVAGGGATGWGVGRRVGRAGQRGVAWFILGPATMVGWYPVPGSTPNFPKLFAGKFLPSFFLSRSFSSKIRVRKSKKGILTGALDGEKFCRQKL